MCVNKGHSRRLHHVSVVSDNIQPVALLPQVVSSAEDEVGFGVEGGAHFAQPALAAGTLQAVLMPELIQGLQQVAVLYLAVAAGAAFGLGVRLNGEHLYSCKKRTSSGVSPLPSQNLPQEGFTALGCPAGNSWM